MGSAPKSAAENPTAQTQAKSRKKWFPQQPLPDMESFIFASKSHFQHNPTFKTAIRKICPQVGNTGGTMLMPSKHHIHTMMAERPEGTFPSTEPSHRDLGCSEGFPARSWRLMLSSWFPTAQEMPVPLAGPLCPRAAIAAAASPAAGLGLQHPPPRQEQLRQMCSNPASSLQCFAPF